MSHKRAKQKTLTQGLKDCNLEYGSKQEGENGRTEYWANRVRISPTDATYAVVRETLIAQDAAKDDKAVWLIVIVMSHEETPSLRRLYDFVIGLLRPRLHRMTEITLDIGHKNQKTVLNKYMLQVYSDAVIQDIQFIQVSSMNQKFWLDGLTWLWLTCCKEKSCKHSPAKPYATNQYNQFNNSQLSSLDSEPQHAKAAWNSRIELKLNCIKKQAQTKLSSDPSPMFASSATADRSHQILCATPRLGHLIAPSVWSLPAACSCTYCRGRFWPQDNEAWGSSNQLIIKQTRPLHSSLRLDFSRLYSSKDF